MSDYDFIIDNIRFSYSALSTYSTCPYSYKLSYIDSLPRENNFYSEYGTLVHECLEKYFKGELDIFELSLYYNKRYNEVIISPPPPYPPDISSKYRQEGEIFFNNFNFDIENYEIIFVEDKIDLDIDGIDFVARPDLVLKHTKTKKNILYDYKTSMPFRTDKKTGREIVDRQKMISYHKQMRIYSYALRHEKNIPIDDIMLWFIRGDRKELVKTNKTLEKETIKWLKENVKAIKEENIFAYNNSNTYFCNILCNVRNYCKYKDL